MGLKHNSPRDTSPNEGEHVQSAMVGKTDGQIIHNNMNFKSQSYTARSQNCT